MAIGHHLDVKVKTKCVLPSMAKGTGNQKISWKQTSVEEGEPNILRSRMTSTPLVPKVRVFASSHTKCEVKTFYMWSAKQNSGKSRRLQDLQNACNVSSRALGSNSPVKTHPPNGPLSRISRSCPSATFLSTWRHKKRSPRYTLSAQVDSHQHLTF